MRTRILLALLGSLGLALGASAHATDGTLIRDAELKAKPLVDAPTVKALTAKTPLSVKRNEGGWSEIKTEDGAQGWVRLLNIRLKAIESSDGSIGKTIGDLGNVARTGSTKGAATTGAKGLTKEEITNATPNMAEVNKMENFKSSDSRVKRFVSTRKLHQHEVAELNP